MKHYYRYQGGSLSPDDPTYVERQADCDLFESLIAGEFCYILNARQMGKSSLYGRAIQKLQHHNIVCAVVDLSNIESQVTSSQWYKILAYKIMNGLKVNHNINLKTWWKDNESPSSLQSLNELIEEIILPATSKKIVIFIDEIDTVLSLQFSTDDLFAFIRSCYNARAYKSDYNRLSFCLIGVASPSQLVQDKQRTPFNIGRAIELTGLTLENAIAALAPGLQGKVKDPKGVLIQILAWTGGQPFLTQKVCHLVAQQEYCLDIEALIRELVIANWEQNDEPIHFRHIKDRIFTNPNREELLEIYETILLQKSILADESEKHLELRLSGLVKKEGQYLKVFSQIYAEIFNSLWVRSALEEIQNQTFKSLPKLILVPWQLLNDFRYRKIGLGLISILLLFLSVLVRNFIYSFENNKPSIIEHFPVNQKNIEPDIIKDFTFSPDNQTVVSGSNNGTVKTWQLKDGQLLETLTQDRDRILSIEFSPNGKILAWGNYINEIKFFQQEQDFVNFTKDSSRIWSISFSPDSQTIAAVGGDGGEVIRIWDIETQTILQSLTGHRERVVSIDFSPNGKILASASDDKTVKIWDVTTGELLNTLTEHNYSVLSVNFSPDGKKLASGSEDNMIKIWDVETGKLLNTLTGHNDTVWSVSFSPDGKKLASGSEDNTIKIWDVETGKLSDTLIGHRGWVLSVNYSPDGKILASGGADCTIKMWNPNTGKEIRTLSEPCDRTHP